MFREGVHLPNKVVRSTTSRPMFMKADKASANDTDGLGR
jgi:hypothetical protein